MTAKLKAFADVVDMASAQVTSVATEGEKHLGCDDGEVTVKASVQDDTLTLSVHNRGVGFTPEQQSKLFQRFSRLKQKGTEDRRGTGLGLYLVWWILETHGGTIEAESEPGEWARFTLTLPRAALDEPLKDKG